MSEFQKGSRVVLSPATWKAVEQRAEEQRGSRATGITVSGYTVSYKVRPETSGPKFRWGSVHSVKEMTHGRVLVVVQHDSGALLTWPAGALVLWGDDAPVATEMLTTLCREEWEARHAG